MSFVQTSEDGHVLVFQKETGIFVADAGGIRPVDVTDNYFLDPGGEWLLATDGAVGLRSYSEGDRFSLLRLADMRRYETTLPDNIGYPSAPRGVAAATRPARVEAQPAESASIYFCAGPQILIGWDATGYWRWRPEMKPPGDWAELTGEEMAAQLAAGCAIRATPKPECSYPPPDCIVEMPSDGLTAFRSIWVRPDGSTLELARKDDAPARFLAAVGATLAAPLGLFADYQTGSILNQISCAIGVPLLNMMSSWAHALADLEVNHTNLEAARERLQTRISSSPRR